MGINNHVRHGDQIFFLFNNHPQFNSLTSLTCTDCASTDQTYIVNNNHEQIEQNTDRYERETDFSYTLLI